MPSELQEFVRATCGGGTLTLADERRLIDSLRTLPDGSGTVTERLVKAVGLKYDESEENVLRFYKIFPHWIVLYPLLSCPACQPEGLPYDQVQWLDYRHQAVGLWGGMGQVIRCVTEAHDWTAQGVADWLEGFFAQGRAVARTDPPSPATGLTDTSTPTKTGSQTKGERR